MRKSALHPIHVNCLESQLTKRETNADVGATPRARVLNVHLIVCCTGWRLNTQVPTFWSRNAVLPQNPHANHRRKMQAVLEI